MDGSKLYDEDEDEFRLLGIVKVSLSCMKRSTVIDQWYTILPAKRARGNMTGSVHLRISYISTDVTLAFCLTISRKGN